MACSLLGLVVTSHLWNEERGGEGGGEGSAPKTWSFLFRFQLPFRSVCGGSKDQWVQELMSCFDRRGEHFPSPPQAVSSGLGGLHLTVFFASGLFSLFWGWPSTFTGVPVYQTSFNTTFTIFFVHSCYHLCYYLLSISGNQSTIFVFQHFIMKFFIFSISCKDIYKSEKNCTVNIPIPTM